MTKYFITAWCDRVFSAQCEVDAENPQEALSKARKAIHDAPAEECDDGYYWDQWKVDSGSCEGELLKDDRNPWRPIETAPKDGTKIDVINRHGERTTDVWYGKKGNWLHWEQSEFGGMGEIGLDIPPTHWMPLPPAQEASHDER